MQRRCSVYVPWALSGPSRYLAAMGVFLDGLDLPVILRISCLPMG